MTKNLKIQASETGIEIDILGEIGESFFDEGITIDSVKSALNGFAKSDITVNIASLGGDALQGLAIYDMLKSHSGRVTAKIIGATASAATIVAMGADEVVISENSLFLIHNSHTIAMGNAEDMERVAEDLKKVDARMTKIYRKRTGKSEAFIRNLMSEDKWITPEEAKQHGFVDRIQKPVKAMALATVKAINDSDLPKININMKQFEKINALLKVEAMESTDEGAFLNAEQMEAIEAKITEAETLAATVTEKETALASATEAHAAEMLEIQGRVEKSETEVAQAAATITSLNAEIDTLKAKVAELEKAPAVEPITSTKLNAGEMKLPPAVVAFRRANGIE